MSSPRTVVRNALRPGYVRTMVDKVLTRVTERRHAADRPAAAAWAADHAEPAADFARVLDADLWAEAEAYAAELRRRAAEQLAVLRQQGVVLGGGGDYGLLYFLTRHLRPRTVLETGVAAGWSSEAFLAALAANGEGGQLWSSDFPYFRLEDPERYVGLLVSDEFREHWHLFVRGDRANLAEILPRAGRIDLFHYDSDKSYRGRTRALAAVRPSLGRDSHVVFDDIDDNAHFRDVVTRTGAPFRVFGFGDKYLGLIGELARR